jgi:hypothetical protein
LGPEQEEAVPKQNRVTPFGELVAVPERGTFMGNRGCLHDEHERIRRSWQLKRWIVCVLEFKDRKRQVMRPGHYTELFFLDEASALAAGHRPCAECRWPAFNAFRLAIAAGRNHPCSAVALDLQLHKERLNPDGSKRVHTATIDPLPDGAFILAPGDDSTPYLVRGDHLLAWSFAGYTRRIKRPRGIRVRVLTPKFTVRALRGYVPDVHPSARE